MNSKKSFGVAFGAALFSTCLLSGISYGANDQSSNVVSTPAPVNQELPPDLQSAAQRVDMSKSKLEQARQQLSAAKAMLKAAEAEHKAAKADQEALSLRTEARKLADASGLQETGATGGRLYPVDMSQAGAPSIAPASSVVPTATTSVTGAPIPTSNVLP